VWKHNYIIFSSTYNSGFYVDDITVTDILKIFECYSNILLYNFTFRNSYNSTLYKKYNCDTYVLKKYNNEFVSFTSNNCCGIVLIYTKCFFFTDILKIFECYLIIFLHGFTFRNSYNSTFYKEYNSDTYIFKKYNNEFDTLRDSYNTTIYNDHECISYIL